MLDKTLGMISLLILFESLRPVYCVDLRAGDIVDEVVVRSLLVVILEG